MNVETYLPQRYEQPAMMIIGKTDDQVTDMVSDPAFYAEMKERNAQANVLMNLNNPELTKAGDNAAQNATVLVANTNESWINKTWRPLMGYMYLVVCMFDFVVFPILWSLLQVIAKGSVTTPWQPLTLQGAGLFHLAMGAVLGISSYGRTQEKLSGTIS